MEQGSNLYKSSAFARFEIDQHYIDDGAYESMVEKMQSMQAHYYGVDGNLIISPSYKTSEIPADIIDEHTYGEHLETFIQNPPRRKLLVRYGLQGDDASLEQEAFVRLVHSSFLNMAIKLVRECHDNTSLPGQFYTASKDIINLSKVVQDPNYVSGLDADNQDNIVKSYTSTFNQYSGYAKIDARLIQKVGQAFESLGIASSEPKIAGILQSPAPSMPEPEKSSSSESPAKTRKPNKPKYKPDSPEAILDITRHYLEDVSDQTRDKRPEELLKSIEGPLSSLKIVEEVNLHLSEANKDELDLIKENVPKACLCVKGLVRVWGLEREQTNPRADAIKKAVVKYYKSK